MCIYPLNGNCSPFAGESSYANWVENACVCVCVWVHGVTNSEVEAPTKRTEVNWVQAFSFVVIVWSYPHKQTKTMCLPLQEQHRHTIQRITTTTTQNNESLNVKVNIYNGRQFFCVLLLLLLFGFVMRKLVRFIGSINHIFGARSGDLIKIVNSLNDNAVAVAFLLLPKGSEVN